MPAMKPPCEICNGRRMIRLPRYRPAAISFEATAATMDSPYSDFPCPECAPLVERDQIRVAEHFFQADTRYEGQEDYREHLVKMGVMAIADLIERGGLMRLQQAPADTAEFKRGYRVSVGVVAPKVTASLDAEREQAENKFGEEVTKLAIREIDNWGSHYGRSDILKREAVQLIRDAFKQAQARRPR